MTQDQYQNQIAEDLKRDAIHFHRWPTPGKIEVVPTKPLANQRDLALAYSPGVAAPCELIVENPDAAAAVTARGNLVGVITNGTAVLGLGAIGALAAKPVMEGKAVLFKKFAGIDVFDIEIDETDPDKFIEIVQALEPTFGGINLEDIKAPECFKIEDGLKARMKIPVFHDDQHGTAICVCAALVNGLRFVGKDLNAVKVVTSGAGAAAIASLNLLVSLGMPVENIYITDRKGVVYLGRDGSIDPTKKVYEKDTADRTLADAIKGADVFLGMSGPNVLDGAMVKSMAAKPMILALANPNPEILPEVAHGARDDVVMATGRSDYPNQVNNVLCFPYLFRGALDCGATEINEAMKRATVYAIADLAMAESSEIVAQAYRGETLAFGRDYLIPKPFDPRLILQIAPAVVRAAMDSGIAKRPIADFDAYRETLERFVYKSGMTMKPVFEQVRTDAAASKRVVYAEGEDKRVLRAAQVLVDDKVCRPILIGRPGVIGELITELGLRLRAGRDFELLDPDDYGQFATLWPLYQEKMRDKDVSPEQAQVMARKNTTIIAALMVAGGAADAMICGAVGHYPEHLGDVERVIGRRHGVDRLASLSVLVMPQGQTVFLCDTQAVANPSPREIAATTLLAADQVRRFGNAPVVALLSHSNYGAAKSTSSNKMRKALALIKQAAPDLAVDGEMQGDAALDEAIRRRLFPDAILQGTANLLVMPTLDAANITCNVVKTLTGAVSIGPILLGAAKPAHIVTTAVTSRGIVNISALAVVDAQG
ncbi:MAG: NADP-dependent malic enzyme [Proteobacteria bacterium]|nr:NADP-dependent malic enzyme [Pseudomonadota bacterium]